MQRKMKTMNMKTSLAKYLIGGVVVGALALTPMVAHADNDTMSNDTTMQDKTVAAEPTLVTGTVGNYYVDRSGFVTAMSVKTASGTEYVRFSPTKAQTLYDAYPVGNTINVWVTTGTIGKKKYWDARGLGTDRPVVWMPINMTSDFEWLNSEAYILRSGVVGAGTSCNWDGSVSGNLKGVVVDNRNDVVGLVVNTEKGAALVRVPPELRQSARGYIGTNRVSPLIQGARIRVSGTPEAPRLGSLSVYPWRVAANTIAVNDKNAGAVGIQMLPAAQRNTLVNFSIGGDATKIGDMLDENAAKMGYSDYVPVDTVPCSDMGNKVNTSERATGRVMLVTAEGQLLPVVKLDNKIYVSAAVGKNVVLKKVRGKYVIPASMKGARMQMVMEDGRRMDMETVDGQLMVKLANGMWSPVSLHTT